jgi:hypothetical protein
MPSKEEVQYRADLAWAAGLFEGEGCFYLQTQATGRVHPRAALASTDIDILQRFQKIMGFGKIYPKNSGPGNKPIWMWAANQIRHTFATISALFPLLGERRRAQAVKTFMSYKDNHDARQHLRKRPNAHKNFSLSRTDAH